MKSRLNPEKINRVFLVSLVGLFCLFVIFWEKYQFAQERSQLRDTAQVIAKALWNLDSDGPVAYLTLAAEHQNHERITVFAVTNKVFMEVIGPECGFVDMTLESIGLIPMIKLHADVLHKGKVIGRIEATHRHITIYLYFDLLLIMGLILLVARLYAHTVEAKNVLEVRVAERTLELVETNQDMQQEIHERIRAEEALRENEALLRTLIETLPALVWLKDPDGVYLSCNPKFERFFGAKQSEILGKTDYDFIDKDLADLFRKNDKAAMVVGGASLNEEEITYADDGHREFLETIKTPMFDCDGKLIGVLGVGHDITDRKNIETLMSKSEEQWNRTFNAITDIVTLQDVDMNIVKINMTGCDALDLTCEEIVGKHCYELFHGSNIPCPDCPLLVTQTTFEPYTKEMTHEKLGKTFLVSAAPMLDEQGELTNIAHVAKDITEHKKLEAELFQAHKMEAIGTLAGWIAHDFNNILSVIIGYSEITKVDIRGGTGNPEKNIDQILKASRRATELVKQILTFSRKTEHQAQPLNPHLIVKEALKMLRSSLPTTISIQQDIDSECGLVLADPINIHQITMNLCTNALHAMENEKGSLGIRLTRKDVRADQIEESDVDPGSFIVLSISDTGHGMGPETIKRIFEPYFTTKEMGKGTGLGLAVIHGIIKEYNGFIKVASEPGQGTTFHVHIPALEEDGSMEDESADQGIPVPSGTERVLVVDDEVAIVNMNKVVLERLGYQVTGTTDSLDALEKIRTNPDQFDLIITDQTMPNMTGSELAQEVFRIKHNMPIILCTGYSSVLSEKDALSMGIKKYVRKPVDRTTLAKAVREVLDEKQ